MASQTDLWTVVHHVWHIGVAGLALLLSIIASGHAVLYKRDSRAAIAWVFCLAGAAGGRGSLPDFRNQPAAEASAFVAQRS